MIKETSLKSAVTLASALADKGTVAVAKPNTILNELVAASVLPYEIQLNTDDDLLQSFYNLEQITRGTLEDPSQHSFVMDGFIKDLCPIVVGHISHAKNIVKPLVIDFAKDIEDYLTTYKPKLAGEIFDIEVLDIPELVADDSFLDTLKPYKDKTILRPDLKFKLGSKTQEELLSLVTFGYERIDKLILDWVSCKSPEFLPRVYNSFFTTEPTKDIVSYDDIERLNAYEKLDYALATLLIATKLFDNVDESAKEINLQVYKNTAAQIRDYAGALSADTLIKIATFSKTERLIIESSPSTYKVKVNGAIYRPWLQTGGSPEVLLGYVISGDVTTSKNSIDLKSKSYLDQWNSFYTFYNADQSNKLIDFFKQYLTSQFSIKLKDLVEGEQEYIEKNPQYYETVNTIAQNYIENLKKDDIKDVYCIALTLVAQARFFYTSSYNILSDINEAAKVNPNVDVREAALLAVINYVTDYLAAQIAVISNA